MPKPLKECTIRLSAIGLVDISSERSRFAMELGAQVSQEGGKPASDAHYGGILHRGWIDLETRIRPKAAIEILRGCLRGDETRSNTTPTC